MMRKIVLPWLVYAFYRSLQLTWRVTFDECPTLHEALRDRRPIILAHWHGDELALIHLAKRYRIATMTSTSKDGELMDNVLKRLGAVTSRGSSTRGGSSALRGLISLCRKQGRNVSFAVDGPKGVIYKTKPGVFEFSRLMNAPVYTVSVGVSNPWISERSWNKAVLPKWFSRVHVRVVPALPPVTSDMCPRDVALAEELEGKLHAGKRLVCTHVGCERP